LSQSADRIDHLQGESHDLPHESPKSTTFVAYWVKSQEYEKWKETEAVPEFWKNLPDDAGVWREGMTVPKSRYMFAANQYEPCGLATMLGLKDSSDEAYWGAYRHRLSANPDEYTDPTDTFTSPLVTTTKVRPGSAKQSVDLSKTVSNTIRKGRVKLTN